MTWEEVGEILGDGMKRGAVVQSVDGAGESSKAKLDFCRANEFGKCFRRAISAQKALRGLGSIVLSFAI